MPNRDLDDRDLRSIAVEVANENPGLRWFADQVVKELDCLRSRVHALEQVKVGSATARTEHESTVLADELLELYSRLDAVRALCDMADWADSAANDGAGRSTVLVSDVRASLLPRRS